MFVKICGLANEDDALLAAALGADAVGLVFAPSSRQVSSAVARDIVRRLPPEILTVGVFRNESRSRVVELANRIGLRTVQLHGQESPEDTRWIAERVPSVIRAFSITDPALRHLDEFGSVDVLVDGSDPGSGNTFDWSALLGLALDRPIILAGGLDPDNVAEAIATVRPWGVDVSTGVEAGPGHKDPVKVRRFIANARAAFAALPEPPDEIDELASAWVGHRPDRSATLAPEPPDAVVDADATPPLDLDLDAEPFDWKEDTSWN